MYGLLCAPDAGARAFQSARRTELHDSMSREAISYDIQAEVFFRDRWLCSHCRRPTIFPLVLKLLGERTAAAYPDRELAYWNPQWRRDAAPLLDELAASVDHVVAYSAGGAHDLSNFATICARCNARKGTRSREEHLALDRPWQVRGKYGEPRHWDGFASLFIVLASELRRPLTSAEAGWLATLTRRMGAPAR